MKSFIRWILCLPCGAVAGGLAGLLYMAFGQGNGTWFVAILSGGFSGAVAVYITCYVAPDFESKVAVVVATLLLVSNAYGMIMSVQFEEWMWAVFNVGQAIGGIIMAHAIWRGELQCEKTDFAGKNY